jgi:DNA-binding beta-propeller fold protein YncE
MADGPVSEALGRAAGAFGSNRWPVARAAISIAASLVAACGSGAADPGADSGADAAPCDGCPVLLGSWGGRGTEPGQFIEPSSVELDSQGVVIVAGHEDRVQRFTGDGALIDIFGVSGAGDGAFNHPHGLAVDRQRGDLLYVGDQENHRLQVFTAEGDFLRQWGDLGFQHIHDIGIDRASGDVFAGDYELDTLRRFTSDGELVAELGGYGAGPGEFRGVWGVSTDSSGALYVADTHNQRIQKLEPNGELLDEWTGYRGRGFEKPTGVYVDDDDVIYVCDSLAEVVVLFDPSGAVLETWNLAAIIGERTEPEDIVIDPAGEHVYVAEVYGHRVFHLVRP